jgi:hypothetical protein
MPNLLRELKRAGVDDVADERLRRVTEQPACEFVDLLGSLEPSSANTVRDYIRGMNHRWSRRSAH